jgi:hypothetical protein
MCFIWSFGFRVGQFLRIFGLLGLGWLDFLLGFWLVFSLGWSPRFYFSLFY